MLLLRTILYGDQNVSRLARALRHSGGLAYNVFGSSDGEFAVWLGTHPDRAEEAAARLQAELRKLSREGVTRQELDTAKKYACASFPVSMEGNASLARFLLDAEIARLGPEYLSSYCSRLQAVTLERVNAVARRIQPPLGVTVVVRPATSR